MQILSVIRSIVTLPGAILKWINSTIVAPVNDGKPLPPIRYDGDPTEVYLA